MKLPRVRRLGRRTDPTDPGTDESPPKAFHSACYAPTVSMYFDQFGNVRACCQNTEWPLGNVTTQSIREIWDSAATKNLRDALRADDYSAGCGFCAWQVEQGDTDIVFARTFDIHSVVEEHPSWPKRMEFSMTNSCNLQCIMCNGDWSSSIRAHREHRSPLPDVYGDAFFEELAEFLPHLQKTNFLGGEPFLGKEPLRVLSMLAELDDPPEVAVTTNGTQWSPRIESILERLPISFVLSLDGITKSTYESIRVGANFDLVMANLDRFRFHAEQHGTQVSIAHCLMRPNWHEFADLLRFAEDRGLPVGMNEVLFPVELSLFQLPPRELREVVEEMERDDGGTAESLVSLRPVWDGQVQALRHRLETLEAGEVQFIRPWGAKARPDWEREAIRTLTEWVGDKQPTRVELDRASGKCRISGDADYFLTSAGVPDSRTVDDVTWAMAAVMPSPVNSSRPASSLVNDLVLGEDGGNDSIQVRLAWREVGEASTVFVAVRNPPPRPVLPEDPIGELLAWSDAGSIVTLELGLDGRVERVTGDTTAMGLGTVESVAGRSSEELMTALAARHGSPVLEPGPSGLTADVMMSFEETSSSPILRIMTDTTPAGAVVLLAIRTSELP